ncbi:MAG: carboxypeptidase-like regulatory domain-containing protein [Planctomycetota bacterium]
MRKHTFLHKAASLALCFGIMLTSNVRAFDGGRRQVARDIELTADGTLQGQVRTAEGRPVENAEVELRYQGTPIARTMTGATGEFSVTGVRGGAHDLHVGAVSSPIRLWKNGTAPEGSLNGIVVSADEEIIRGQACDPYGAPCNTCPPTSSGFGLIDVVTLAMLGTAVTGLVVAIDNSNEIDDLKNQLASP